MFKKKPTIKPLAPLRSSDRRKIADQIITDLHVEVPLAHKDEGPQISPSQTQDDANGAIGLAAVRNSILPENSMYGKFTTTAGPDLKSVNGVVYAGSFMADEQRILWVKIEDRMFPTVYTLWRNPKLVPLLYTPSLVVGKLRGGADLMIPGLARGPPFPEAAAKDAIVAIASDEHPSVPLVVGICEIDVNRLQSVRGAKGKAVRCIQWVGDELWEWSTAGKPGATIPEAIDGWDVQGDVQVEQLKDAVEDLDVDADETDDQGGVALQMEQPGPTDAGDPGSEQVPESTSHEDPERHITTQEIDSVFHQAFLYGLYHFKTTKPEQPNHGLEFPLSSSFVISDLVLPFLPIFSPAEAAAYQIKKTSWKNAKKFIKFLDKEVLVKSKERSGGEVVVLDVDFNDRQVIGFRPYDLPRKASSSANAQGSAKDPALKPDADSSVGQRLRRIVLYRPKEKLAPIFKSGDARVKSTYTASEIKPIVTSYIEAESLVVPNNKRLVKLNPVLANAVFDSSSGKDHEVLVKGEVTREALVERVLQTCSPLWAILRGDQTTDEVKPKAGTAPQIQILLETRSGNKTVTKTSGLEAYFINPQVLADELQKSCASSTSVSQLAGSSPKSPSMEVMVQGPQSPAVIKALERRGVNKQWVDVVDKTKGKKRG